MPLFIVSTPIGNLTDLTYRAVKVLNDVDCICAEDTRISKILLNHYGISKRMVSYHDHNENRVTLHLVERLKNGDNIALITDAGTPGIADPAFFIVRASIRENIQVIPVPGASAVLAGLVCSGLPCERYIFENFLPHKSTQRKRLFELLREERRTIIFYETPHRILKVLSELNEVLGSINVVIARELTKMHEEFLRGTPETLLLHFQQKVPRGEMVVMITTRKDFTWSTDNNDVHSINGVE